MKNKKYICWEPFGEKGDNVKRFSSLDRMNSYLNDAIRNGKIIAVKVEK